jgi:hypothetical protein
MTPAGTYIRAAVLIVFLLTLSFVNWKSRKVSRQDLDRIKPGMSQPEVEAIGGPADKKPEEMLKALIRQFHKGIALQPGDAVYRWGDKDNYVIVVLRDGRVAHVIPHL